MYHSIFVLVILRVSSDLIGKWRQALYPTPVLLSVNFLRRKCSAGGDKTKRAARATRRLSRNAGCRWSSASFGIVTERSRCYAPLLIQVDGAYSVTASIFNHCQRVSYQWGRDEARTSSSSAVMQLAFLFLYQFALTKSKQLVSHAHLTSIFEST